MRRSRERGSRIAFIAILFCALVAQPSCRAKRDLTDRLSTAVATLAERPITARIASFEHRPPPTKTRSVAAPVVSTRLIRARGIAAEVLEEADGTSHVAAMARLVAGDARGAVDVLEALIVKEPPNAVLWSDLSAARYELATSEDDPAIHAAALAAADAALRLQPAMQPALFNRALSLEALALRPAALKAFDRYRALDSTSGWATEALHHSGQLDHSNRAEEWTRAKVMLEQGREIESIVRRFPQQARTAAESDYLSRWGEALLQGDPSAASQWLGVARAVGRALMQQRGERLLSDAVAAIDSAAEPPAIAEAYLVYRRGRLLYRTESGLVVEALPYLKDAEHRFAAVRSPMSLVAAYYYANALFLSHQTEKADSVIQRLLETSPRQYRALHAQLSWLRSTIAANLGQPYASLTAGQEAAEQFRHIGEDENAARMDMATSTTLQMLGRLDEAHRVRRRTFEAASAAGKASLWEVVLNSAGRDEVREQRWDVALSLFSVELENEPVSPSLRFDALLWHAGAKSRLNNEKYPDLGRAAAFAVQISDPAIRADVENELRFVEGVALIDTNPGRATELLSTVIDFRLNARRIAELTKAYAERARAHRSAGQLDEAEKDLHRAIEITEEGGDSIERDDLRDTFFGGKEDVDQQLVELLVARDNLEEAVEVAERALARGLLTRDRHRRSQGGARSIALLTAGVPPDSVVVHYTTLTTKTLISIIEKGRHSEFLIDTSRRDIVTLRDRLTEAVLAGDHSAQVGAGRRLYDLLIRPVLERARMKGETLAIVTDEILAALPFALLVSPSGRYLAEEVVIINAISASTFVEHAREHAFRLQQNSRFAVIADPDLNQTLFPQLQRLPAARNDASVLSRRHTATVLTDREATPSRAIEALDRAVIAHIGAHTVIDRTDAWRSLFAMAPDQSSDGSLYLHQIADHDLRQLRLAMLAGCRTGSSGGGKGSIRSLARAFLAAGSHNVVSTLWDVDDSAISVMTGEFYSGLDRGQTAAAALQSAQLFMKRSDNAAWASPRTWGAVQLHGCNR
jgi:CHAT domain-containing protein